jgi:hydroxyacylglutathione hydrolase
MVSVMSLTIQAIPAFQDNYIWIIQVDGSQHVLIVDPGEAEPVLEAIKQQNLIPVGILITHHHHDHIGGIVQLLEHYDIPVYGPKIATIPSVTHPLTANDTLIIDPAFPAVTVLDIPGHTAAHIAFLFDNCLFCGDTLFGAGCGRLLGGTAEQLFHSLQKIAQLPTNTKVYCAHEYTQTNLHFAEVVEPENSDIQQRIHNTNTLRQQGKPSLPSTLALELATNPFLRCGQPNVIHAAELIAGKQFLTALEVFTELRLWKDCF